MMEYLDEPEDELGDTMGAVDELGDSMGAWGKDFLEAELEHEASW